MPIQSATAMETALGLQLEKLARHLARVECDKGIGHDCFTCERSDCEYYWGPDTFQIVTRESEVIEMPPKKGRKV